MEKSSFEDIQAKLPILRFKESGKWLLFPVSSLLKERNEQSPQSVGFPLKAFIANIGIADKGDRYDRSALINDVENKLYKRTYWGDFIYSSNNLESGSIGMNRYGHASISPVYSIFQCINDNDSQFVGFCLSRKHFIKEMVKWRQGVTYGQWRIHEADFLRIHLYIPSTSDQRKISAFLSALNDLVMLRTKKIESLKQLKSASMISMFPQKGETRPRIRFKGFDGDWSCSKLSQYATRIVRKNQKLETSLPLTISAVDGLVAQDTFFNSKIASSNLQGYYLLKKGEFAYNKSYSNGYPFGAVKRLEKYPMGALSVLYIVFELNENISHDYMTQFFETTLWYGEIAKRAAEGARNHGLLNISAEDFLDIQIVFPKSIEEQNKIASFFRNLDKQISLETQRLEKLKQIKYACLDKMFV
jgi:type I restriction enzyme S subunit